MNILYLNNEMTIGGVAKCILELTKELYKENSIYIASKENGRLLGEFEKMGIKNHPLIDIDSKLPHNIIINIIRIYKIVKKNNIDVIHSHHRMTTLLAKIVSKLTGVKVVHTQHLCIEDKFMLTHFALKNLNIITVSNSAKDILIEKSKLDAKRILTIYNTVNTECLNDEIDNTLLDFKKKGYFIVAQVSRAVNYKGVYDFIEVAKKEISINKNIRFVFIGDGVEYKNMQQKIDLYNLGDYIKLLGSKSNVIKQLKYIDVLLLCSYIEGLPLSPLEAFSQGVPVIATKIGGTDEEIVNDYNGYLVDKEDIQGFVNNINKLYSDKKNYKIISENCIKDFYNRFSPDKYCKSYYKVYEGLLAK